MSQPADSPRPEVTPTLYTHASANLESGTLPAPGETSAPPSAASPPRYQVSRFHASGGLGEVHVARDAELQRDVALKQLRPERADDVGSRRRFVLEAEVTGRLEHPGVVPVYGLGTYSDGRPYYAMRFIKGESLDKAIRRFHQGDKPRRDAGERSLALRDLLRRFIDVCNAVGYAHSKGVLHRDLKPENVMLGPFGETLVVDWGLAKLLAEVEETTAPSGVLLTSVTSGDGTQTQEGAVVGTPMFMSPEQASARNQELTPATDIYALGAILYTLLTNRLPFENTPNALVLLGRVIKGAIRPPRAANALVPSALEAVCLKAMAKDPEARYGSAKALAGEIENWLADEPVSAYREPLTFRLRRWARRHRTLVTSATLILVTMTAALAIGLVFVNTARQETVIARDEERRAKEDEQKANGELTATKDVLLRANYIADMNLAHHAWADGNMIRTRELLDKHVPGPAEPELRGFEWHYLTRLFHGELHVLQAHAGYVTAIAFTANGKRLWSCGRTQTRHGMSVSEARQVPREIKFWDAATGRQLPLGLKDPTEKVIHLAVSPDGSRLAAACGDQGIRLWDLTTGEQSTLPRHEQERDVYVGFSPDGKRLVAASLPDRDAPEVDCLTARVWDLAEPRVVMTLEKLQRFSKQVEFSPDGKLLAFADTPRDRVQVFDASTGQQAFTCQYRDGRVYHAVFSPDGTRLAACGEGGVQFWEVATHEAVAAWPIASNSCDFLAYSPEGKRLALATREGAVELWDTGTKQRVNTFNGHSGYLYMVAFSADGTQLASAGQDGTVRLWEPAGRREVVPLARSAPDINHLDFGPDGKSLLAYVPGKTIQFWDAATGEPRGDPIVKTGWWGGMSFCWTADGKRVFAIDGLKHIQVFDAATGKTVRTLEVDAEGLGAIAVSPDGKWCAHAAPGGAAKVRDAVTGAESQILQGFDHQIYYLAFSPDGSRLLGVDDSSRVKFWDRATGHEIAATQFSDVYVLRVRYSTDGKLVAVVGFQHRSSVGDIRVLDAQTGRELAALKGHTLSVGDADFSPDGQRLATCSADKTVRLWDLASRQEILTLRGHTRQVTSVRFISDGKRLLSAAADRTVRIWDATPLPE